MFLTEFQKKFVERETFKPKKFVFCDAFRDKQLAQGWVPSRICYVEDRKTSMHLDTNSLSVLRRILMFFTQADLNVQKGQGDFFATSFKGCPEMLGMIGMFNAIESIHADAYSDFVDVLEFESSFYTEFKEVEIFKQITTRTEKISNDLNQISNMSEWLDILLINFVVSEGVYLFTFFILLLSFYRTFKSFHGLEEIVRYSIKDEILHVNAYRTLVYNLNKIDSNILNLWVNCCKIYKPTALEIQKEIIDFIFREEYSVNEIQKDLLLDYAEFNYDAATSIDQQIARPNPIPWIGDYLNQLSVDFFSIKSTAYKNVL